MQRGNEGVESRLRSQRESRNRFVARFAPAGQSNPENQARTLHFFGYLH
jgi:hypothetical protein